MKLFLLLTYLFAMNAMAQGDQYQVKGSLKKGIDFTLKWSEKNGKANGTYSDNFYTKSAVAKGISGKLGRIFVVTFPKEIKGVQTISFLGSDFKPTKKSSPTSVIVVLRDQNGKPVNTTSILAAVSGIPQTRVAQRQEEERCQQGFGALAGFCGIYTGLLSEDIDARRKCNLLGLNNVRLVMDENGEMGLLLGPLSAIINPPVHRIGRIFSDPDSTRIDIMSRHCRALLGTKFNGDDCKRLNLLGTFSTTTKLKHFSGKYTIYDEKTNESCRYSLSMDMAI